MKISLSDVSSGLMEKKITQGIPASNEDINFQPGQIYRGTVIKEVGQDTYLVKINHRNLIIHSPKLPLVQGMDIMMEILEQKAGRYMVQLLGFDSSAGAEEDILTDLLNQLIIKDTPVNRGLILGFLSHEIPLKPALLQRAGLLVEKLSGNTSENIKKVLMTLKMGLSLDPKAMEALNSFLESISETKRGTEYQLADFINKLTIGPGLLSTEGEKEKNIKVSLEKNNGRLLLSKEGDLLFKRVQDQVEAMVLKPEKGTVILSQQLRNLLCEQLPRLPHYPEQQVVHVSSKTYTSENNPILPEKLESPNLFDPDKDVRSQEEVITSIVNNAADDLYAQERSREPEMKARAFSDTLQNFSRLMVEVKKALKEVYDFSAEDHPLIQEGEKLEKQIAGHQIFQSLERQNNRQNYLYFNLPFIQNVESQTWGQLRIYKEGGKEKVIDLKHLSLALFLNTENLGPLLLELKVREKDIMVNGKITEEWAAQMLKKAWPGLQKGFGALGYNLHPCLWQVGKFSGGLEPRESVNSIHLHSLDITV